MTIPSSAPVRPRRRWFQWRLRTMLVLLTLTGVVLALRVTYQKLFSEPNAIQRLKQLGANVTSEFEAPSWIQRLAGLEKVGHGEVVAFPVGSPAVVPGELPPTGQLASADDAGEVCGLLAQLPRLREISLIGEPVHDRHLRYFRGLAHLESVKLWGSQVTVAGIEEFAGAAVDIDIDVACAERLYHATLRSAKAGVCWIEDAIFGYETAANWKRACTEFQGEGAELAALDQLVRWLDRLADHMRTKNAREPATYTPQHFALVSGAALDALRQIASGCRSTP